MLIFTSVTLSKQIKALQNENIIVETALTKAQEERNQAKKDTVRAQEEKDATEAKIEQEKENVAKVTEELEKAKSELRQAKKKLQESGGAEKATRGGVVSTSYQTFEATGYCPCSKCCGKWAGGPTASGVMPKANRTIAVDSSVIPLGSKVEIEGMGIYTAEDTGSAVKGKIVDIYHNKHSDAWAFGRQEIKLRILN